MKVIYLHGFNSSGSAHKSQLLRQALTDCEFISPNLPHHPKAAVALIRSLYDQNEQVVFVGSSLGGFYAAFLANESLQAKAVLINPAVSAFKSMQAYFGRYINPHTGEEFEVSERFVDELKNFLVTKVHRPGRFLLLLQTDDNVLDYHDALHLFPDSPHIIKTGGGHLFTDFESVIPAINDFIKGT